MKYIPFFVIFTAFSNFLFAQAPDFDLDAREQTLVSFDAPTSTFIAYDDLRGYRDDATGSNLEGSILKEPYEKVKKEFKSLKSSENQKILLKEVLKEEEKEYLLLKYEMPAPENSHTSFKKYIRLVVVFAYQDKVLELEGTYPKPFDNNYMPAYMKVIKKAGLITVNLND